VRPSQAVTRLARCLAVFLAVAPTLFLVFQIGVLMGHSTEGEALCAAITFAALVALLLGAWST